MRRATLGSMSPSQLNSRGGTANAATRGVSKQARASLNAKQNAVNIGRPSLSRRSSQYGKGSNPQTETRPIGDRGFQQECIRILVNYLTVNGYSNTINAKLLQAPSSKDVTSIIQFLFNQIDPSHKFVKIEEDVPIFFKKLGYPVQISRSALYAAGSPVSWPSLLAALTWLAQLLIALEPSENDPEGLAFDDVRGTTRLFNDYINNCYAKFLSGDDDGVEKCDSEYLMQFEEEREKDEAEVAEYEATLIELKEKLRVMRTEPSPLVELETKKTDFQDDIQKFEMVLENFSSHVQSLEVRRDERRQELAIKKEEVVNVLKENEELKEKVSAQQINAAYVEKMLKENEILDVNIESVTTRKQDLEKAAWDFEVQSSKKLRDLEAKVGQFNDSCQRLKPASAEESQENSQFVIKLQPRADNPDEILGGTLKTILKPAFTELSEACSKNIKEELEPEARNLVQHLFTRERASQEKIEQISKSTAQVQKLEARYNAKKDKLDALLAARRAEREELEAKSAQEELVFQLLESEVEQRLKELQVELEETNKLCNEELEYYKNEGTEILDIILSAKEETQVILNRVEEVVDQSVQIFHGLLLSP